MTYFIVDRIPTNTINELTKKGDKLTKKGDSSRSKRPSDVLQTHAKDVKDVGDIQSLEKKKTELSNELSNIDRQIETQEKESIKEFDRALKDLNQSKSQAERSIGSLTTEIKALQEYVTSLSKQFLGAQQLKLSEAHRGKAIPDSIKPVIEEARKRVQQANTQIREVNKSGTVLRIQESDTSKYIWKEVKRYDSLYKKRQMLYGMELKNEGMELLHFLSK